MLTVEKIIGNAENNQTLKSMYQTMKRTGKLEIISIDREESERVRLRKKSDKGTDVVLLLPRGSHIGDGDVLFISPGKMIVAKRTPESVGIIKLHKNMESGELVKIATTIGHVIGNLHRPIKIDSDMITFPIQSVSELSLFEKLLTQLRGQIEISSNNIVFEPNMKSDVYESH
jgi:urease accessory protein